MMNMVQPRAGVNSATPKNRRKFSLFDGHAFGQWVTNVWAATLTPSEYMVLSAIKARTLAWGKHWEVIPVRHLMDGIHASEGGKHYHGVNLSKPTILKALDRLTAEGYILRRALGKTFSYAINFRVMNTAADPGLIRNAHRHNAKAQRKAALHKLHQAQRAAIVEAEARWRATQDDEDKATWLALLGPVPVEEKVAMLPVRKRTRCAVENTNENSENVVNIGKAALPIKKEHKVSFNPSDVKEPKPAAGLPSRRSRGDAHPSEAAAPAGQHWRDRTSRTRRHVATTEENIPVLRHAMEAEPLPHPRHAERVAASLPPTAPGLESILHKAVQNVTTRRRAQALREDARTTDLDQLWRAAITTKAAGHHPPLWTVRDKGRMRHNIRKIDLPDPAMRWGAIIEWVARHWGEATSLAIPFMLRDADKREGILQAMPSLSLFLHFTDHYVQAYATKWHGRGHRAEDEERARQDAAMHDRWMNRAAAVHQRGYDNLPREHMENDELEDVVTRLAQNDAEAQAVLDGREEHRALVRQFRRRYGANYRAVLQTHIARERRRLDMEADGGPDLSDLYPTHDYSDE